MDEKQKTAILKTYEVMEKIMDKASELGITVVCNMTPTELWASYGAELYTSIRNYRELTEEEIRRCGDDFIKMLKPQSDEVKAKRIAELKAELETLEA